MTEEENLQMLKKRHEELKRIIREKQFQIDFYSKMMEIAEEEYGIDFSKYDVAPTSGSSDSDKKNSPPD